MRAIIASKVYQESLWKNGKGKTKEIAIFPHDATLAQDNFLWRISSAEVTSASSFSKFIGCNRHLIVWKGEGLRLNESILKPNTLFSFSGEDDIGADIINNIPVIDFGIIYKKEKIDAKLEILHLSSRKENLALDFKTSLFFLADGDCCFNHLKLEIGDSIYIEDEESTSVVIFKKAVLYKVTITQKMECN